MRSMSMTIAGILLSIILFSACNKDVIYKMADASDEELPTSLDEIMEASEIIVKGYFGELLEKVNMVRLADDPTMPSEDFYTEGHVYEFFVDETYKGDNKLCFRNPDL
ncbi:hypothetical protein SAMN05421736_110113 [Evansella caseinilytica]|uniref:Uncharacterized protein n=1 Tax=Evansella caseinilytica TaxID=1503961 RepID=A0A1H3SBU6_9BACI|nr:hypothetical protein SAMN05421736_110113 [Evansella caseinilytica]